MAHYVTLTVEKYTSMCYVKHLQATARPTYVYHSMEQDFHSGIYVAILFDKLLCKEQNANVDASSLFLPGWP